MLTRVLLALLLSGCAAPGPTTPYLLLLGTAQDGGYPQIACRQPLCEAARADENLARHVVSGLIVDPQADRRWLIDASPDLQAQVELARGHGGPAADVPGRPPLFDGIFLTHAHMGHYAGLLQLGREAYGSQTTPLYTSAAMGRYLRDNGPWSLLFDAGHLEQLDLKAGEALQISPSVSVLPLSVAHRGEFSDTLAFAIQGPKRRVLYLPDIDRWDGAWLDFSTWLAEYDSVLVDGTFFDGDELPGRDMSKIPHPPIASTLEAIEDLPGIERSKVIFFHLNHSNPVLDPDSPQSARVRASGARVAWDGMHIEL
ncbi:MAG TPA: MBL fold metallo-hydrolase [Planctomycetota bacterium]|jgi:pyrroloquinoline quinone biosynthesis protein B|nr:MBL fold metallo-hydrolase [Planctomycetota bacterium]